MILNVAISTDCQVEKEWILKVMLGEFLGLKYTISYVQNEIDFLIKDGRVSGTVPNYLRGASWNAKYVIIDEAQNLCPMSLKTIISRGGKYTKMIFLADESQADTKGPVEFMRYFDIFNDESSKNLGIHCLSFRKEDIVRSPILSYILD